MKRLQSILLTAALLTVALGAFNFTATAATEDVIANNYKHMWKTDWSPDGRNISFSARGEIYMVEVETGKITLLTDNIEDDCTFPIFSHDSTRLFYSWKNPENIKDADGHVQYHTSVMDLATGKTELLLENAYAFNVSVDGRYGVYVKNMITHAIYDFLTGEEKIYDFANSGSVPVFDYGHSEISPDNSHFYTTAGALPERAAWNQLNDFNKIYKVDIVTGEAEKVELGDYAYWYPRFSPDGSKLIMSRIDSYDREVATFSGLKYERNSETGEITLIPPGNVTRYSYYIKNQETGKFENLGYENYYLVPGPQDVYTKDSDGQYVLSDNADFPKTRIEPGLRYEVIIYDLNTGETTTVVDAGYFETKMGSWSSDGTQVCYVLLDENRFGSLYIYDLEQGTHKIVVNGANPDNPVLVEDQESAPVTFALDGNYPNPFNPTTTIEFTLQNAGDVRIDIYNVMGQKIRELVSASMNPGTHSAVWNGRDEGGNPVSSGVYVYRLKMGEQVMAKQMTLTK